MEAFMYLHIGHETVLKHEDIIGIFDIETASVSKITRDYLSGAQASDRIINVTNELPKSFIVCGKSKKKEKNGKSDYKVYISQISSTTLLKRLDFINDLN